MQRAFCGLLYIDICMWRKLLQTYNVYLSIAVLYWEEMIAVYTQMYIEFLQFRSRALCEFTSPTSLYITHILISKNKCWYILSKTIVHVNHSAIIKDRLERGCM